MARGSGKKVARGSPDGKKPYETLLSTIRRRTSSVKGRTLEEEADADRGRVLFSAPFRRLQNKAQVFSLETNAAVRTRLTHSLEVSSTGGYVAQQAIKAFEQKELKELGLSGRERPFITFVETACLLHDLGNPPFGHFGEITICDWFHQNADSLKPDGIAGSTQAQWNKYFADFTHFDGNPQGFRIITRLQASQSDDMFGLNLTATTLAATLKYPWSTENIHERTRKKAGYFLTETEVIKWLQQTLNLNDQYRHPLAYLMEAADDIAYCVSDIEDGIEKGLISAPTFAKEIRAKIINSPEFTATSDQVASADLRKISDALNLLENSTLKKDGREVQRFTPMQDFRASVIRFLTREAGRTFRDRQSEILNGTAASLLGENVILRALKSFAEASLYSSSIVRNREITAHAVITGLLDAYKPIMECTRERFEIFLSSKAMDNNNRRITLESSLLSWISKKYLAVYREAVHRSDSETNGNSGKKTVMERVYRIRLIVDHIAGMTDEFALQSFQLTSGAYVYNYRN